MVTILSLYNLSMYVWRGDDREYLTLKGKVTQGGRSKIFFTLEWDKIFNAHDFPDFLS